jgi:flavin reductase (DIM6/NTAB) family NADH-FMN oxidoreductase RutF
MLAKADFLGMNSGDVIDKAALFNIFYGQLKTAPMINETPLNLECKLVQVIDLKNGSEIFIGEIVETYSSKNFIRRGYPFLKRLDPILFSINSNSYYKIGRRIGWAWKEGLKINTTKLRKDL